KVNLVSTFFAFIFDVSMFCYLFLLKLCRLFHFSRDFLSFSSTKLPRSFLFSRRANRPFLETHCAMCKVKNSMITTSRVRGPIWEIDCVDRLSISTRINRVLVTWPPRWPNMEWSPDWSVSPCSFITPTRNDHFILIDRDFFDF